LQYISLRRRIKKNEGFSLTPYKDQLGHLTVGYGHLILPHETRLTENKNNKAQLKDLFIQDFNQALNDYKKLIKHKNHNKKDEELLIEMVFQMGASKVLKFKKLLSNMRKNKKHLVCFEMMNSLWYTQTPNRVKNLIKVFLRNERRK
jgi:lysozyme|tara:strand:+ start:639 stop:1079 length:441 start_codon:yes stop_codon:yes gene_type:complete